MPSEPPVKRTLVFVDGQNLFHAAKEAFGYAYPNYDVAQLAQRVCGQQGFRIALDIVRSVRQNLCDVALVFSQDEDLSEVADEVRALAREHCRWVKMASAFPYGPTRHYRRGVNRTDWIRIDRATYDASLDPADYRPRRPTA
jgi:uncharacterized LabA/DUF88 family protein